MDIRPETYRVCRLLLESGDVALYRPEGMEPINHAIAHAGRLPGAEPWQWYAHAGMLLWQGDCLMLLETLQGTGGREVTFSSQVRGWSGQYDVYRPLAPFDERAATQVMVRLAGTPYGWVSLARAAAKRILPNLKTPKDRDIEEAILGEDPIWPFCSQAVSMACRAGGRDPCPEREDALTEPGHLADPDFARYVCTPCWTEEDVRRVREPWEARRCESE